MNLKSARFGSIDIPDYAGTITEYRKFVNAASANQPGDPKQFPARIVMPASPDKAAPRLVFGADALQSTGAKIDQLREEIAQSTNGRTRFNFGVRASF